MEQGSFSIKSRHEKQITMSGHNLSVDGEFRYIVQWFSEWSELQREDFLPILAEYLAVDGSRIYMNGTISGLADVSCSDRPMSLFQCRVSLVEVNV